MLKTTMKQILYAIGICATLILFFSEKGWGQSTITIGTGTNYSYDVPSLFRGYYEDSRNQFIITSSELSSAGLVSGAQLTSLSFNIYSKSSTTAFTGFNVKIAHTTSSSFSSASWLTPSFTTVYSDDFEITGTGWNEIVFTDYFTWDGTSNIVIEICWDLGSDYMSDSDEFYYTSVSNTVCYNYDDTGVGCSIAAWNRTSNRPNMKFSYISGPSNPQLFNIGSSSQIAFNNTLINDNTPTFRASATHPSTFDRFQIEINTASDFSGTAFTQTFSSTYSSGTEYDLECSSLSTALPTTNGVTYYVRVRASDDSGSSWGSWSTETYSFTYKSSGDVDWFQTEIEQFNTGTIVAAGDEDYGNTGSAGSYNTGWAGYVAYIPVNITSAGTLSTLNIYLGNVSGTVRMALYNSSNSKIAETNAVTAVNGLNEITPTTTPDIAAGSYYLAFQVSSSSTYVYRNSTGTGEVDEYWSYTYGAFPSSLNLSGSSDGLYLLMNLTLTNNATTTSPAIQYASFNGASGWDELSWTASGTGTVEVGVYSDASCSTEIIAPTSTSPIDLSSVNTTTYPTLYLQATLSGASPSLDDWKVTCNFGLDLDSEAEAPTTQVAAANIASIKDTDGEAQEVFAFDITDMGTADGQPTKVTNIRIKPGNNNAADWTDYIQGIKLYDNDASGFVTIGSPTITDTYIDIPITSGNLNVADGTTKSLSIYIYLNSSNLTDNTILDFRIDYDNHGFTASIDGSRFADEFGSADIEGNNITVTVTATELQFHASEPGSIEAQSQDFDVRVNATDANGNLDVNATGNVTLSKNTGSGTLSSASGLTQAISSGVASWSDVQYDATENCSPNGLKITATNSGALTAVTSSCISIIGAPGAFAITLSDGEACAGTSISITWDASAGADSYDLYWCNTSGCNASTSSNIITNVTSPYSFTLSDSDAEYRITLKAINVASETWANNVLVYTTYNGSTWAGTTNTNWNTASNWCGGVVPDCEDDINIVSGLSNYPILSANASVRSLTVESGASVGLSSYTLSVYGDLDLSGTLNAGTGTITLTNDGCATSPGNQTIDPGTNSLYNLSLDNSGTITLINNDLTLTGSLTISDGTFDINDFNLTIAGNWTNYALFIPGSGTVTFNGSGNSTILKNGPEVVVYSTGFEDSDAGTAGWSLGVVPGKTEWRKQSGAVAGDRLAPSSGTYDLALYDIGDDEPGYFYDGTEDNNSYVDAQKKIDLTDVSSADISFDWYCHGTGTDEFTGVFLADGVEIDDALYTSSTPSSWSTDSYSLDAYCNKETQLTFRMFLISYSFDFPSDPGDYGFAIDNIEITGTESAETFNNLIINKSAGAVLLDDATDTKVNILNDITISSGTLNAQNNRIRCYGDFINNGTFTHGTGEIIFKGDADQTISGTSDITFYDMIVNSVGDLIIGDSGTAGLDVTVSNSFTWKDNNDNLIVGNGTQASLALPGDLTIFNGCGIETDNASVLSLKGHYVNYGTYTPNNGKILFNGASDSFIIKEPSEILYYEGFESDDGGYTLESGSDTWMRTSGSAHNSNWDLAIKADSDNVPYDYLYSSSDDVSASITIDLTGYETAELQFWWRCAGEDGDDFGQVYVNSNLLMDNMHGKTSYQISPRFDISEYANGNVTLEFRWQDDGSGGNSPGLCIDDILITGTSVNMETFYDLEVDKSDSKSTILRCPIDVDNDMIIKNGDFNCSGLDFPVGRHWYNLNSSTFTHGNNTVTFDGNAEAKSQTITNNSVNKFYNIDIDNSGGTVDLETNRLYIENDLDISAGTFDADDQDIMIEGNWSNLGGSFDSSDRTVYFRGDQNQQLISDGDAFYNLSLPFADIPNAGDPIKENSVVLNDNLTINNNLTLSAGSLDIDETYDIEIKGNWFNEGGSFVHPNDESTNVTFSGTSTQKVNLQSDDSTYESNFSFDNVVIDGTDVQFYVDSDNYLLLVRNMLINASKNFKLIKTP
ncbi:MAG: hypothetical protein JXR36_11370 [Bacteroidales bacterium]|nr:hypothetical protein [Bacteroidales bacterium]